MAELVFTVEYAQQFKIDDCQFTLADVTSCLFDMSNGNVIFNIKGGEQVSVPFSECTPFGNNSVQPVRLRG